MIQGGILRGERSRLPAMMAWGALRKGSRWGGLERRPDFINDDNFGEDLARWIIDKLSQADEILADPNPLQEDWGWLVYVSVDQFSVYIGLGAYSVETPEGIKDGWMCFFGKCQETRSLLYSLTKRRHMKSILESKKSLKRSFEISTQYSVIRLPFPRFDGTTNLILCRAMKTTGH